MPGIAEDGMDTAIAHEVPPRQEDDLRLVLLSISAHWLQVIRQVNVAHAPPSQVCELTDAFHCPPCGMLEDLFP